MGLGASRIPHMVLETKRCPSCGEEFLHTVMRCSDCGSDLRLASEVTGAPEDGMPPVSELELIRAEGPAWIEALAARLADQGIDSRVEIIDIAKHGARSGSGDVACGLFVRPGDVQRAREIDAAVQREQIPDVEESHQQGGECEHCPACGSDVPDAAPECPDCGLVLDN